MPLLTHLLLLATLTSDVLSQKCTKQSCMIANLSGSTGVQFSLDPSKPTPSGSSKSGFKCIEKYAKYGAGAPPGAIPAGKGPSGAKATGSPAAPPKAAAPKAAGGAPAPAASPAETGGEEESTLEKRQGSCKPYTLLFARGTLEPGAMGSTVGPALSSGLSSSKPGKWRVTGVNYSADIAGDNCIGLPGGVACMNLLNKINKECPETKFVVSGYSQGAMVAHNCVAFATPEARKQVAGVVVFGDPFNGAPIKDFPIENIKTYCAAGDGVCKGEFKISASHLAYVGTSTSGAVKWMNERVAGGKGA